MGGGSVGAPVALAQAAVATGDADAGAGVGHRALVGGAGDQRRGAGQLRRRRRDAGRNPPRPASAARGRIAERCALCRNPARRAAGVAGRRGADRAGRRKLAADRHRPADRAGGRGAAGRRHRWRSAGVSDRAGAGLHPAGGRGAACRRIRPAGPGRRGPGTGRAVHRHRSGAVSGSCATTSRLARRTPRRWLRNWNCVAPARAATWRG